MIGRPITQVVHEFVPTPPDGFGMQAGDRRYPLESPVSQTHSLARGDPATLLFV
jgi:hypothetical protein